MKRYRNIKIRDWVGSDRELAEISRVRHGLRSTATTLPLFKFAG